MDTIQAFLDFRGFDFRDFQFNAAYISILFSSPLVLLSNIDLRGFCFRVFCVCPHINSVNREMPALNFIDIFTRYLWNIHIEMKSEEIFFKL